jgi:hypothetical protein
MSVRVSVPRVKKVNDQKAIPFASWKSRRVDAHPRVKKSRRRFFSRVAEKEKTRMRRFLVPG